MDEHMALKKSKSDLLKKIIIVLLLAVLAMGILLNPLFTAPGRDSGIFLYIGSLILKGKMPYVSAWENKGPLVFYINALGLLLSGGSRWGIWLMEFLFLFGSAGIGYITTKRHFGTVPALMGAFFWINAAGSVLEGGNLSEEYALLFYFMAAWAFLNSLEKSTKKIYGFLIGISMGLSILLRPNNIGMHVAIMGIYFILFLTSRDWHLFFERMILVALGSMVVILPVLLFFAAKDALNEMYKAVILFNYQYSGKSDLSSTIGGIKKAFQTIGIGYTLGAVIGFLATFLLLFRRNVFNTVRGKFLFLCVAGWLIEMMLSTLSGRNYLHYFILWAPYIGFLSSYAVYLLTERFLHNYEKPLEYATVLALFMFTIFGHLSVWRNYGSTLALAFSSSGSGMDYRLPVADYIQGNTQPSDKVLIWGFRPAVYFMSEREAPASFLPYPLIHVDTPLGYQWGEQFYEQFISDPPVVIVDMVNPKADPIPSINEDVRKTQKRVLRNAILAPSLDRVFDYINTNYVLVGEADGYPVYQLKK